MSSRQAVPSEGGTSFSFISINALLAEKWANPKQKRVAMARIELAKMYRFHL